MARVKFPFNSPSVSGTLITSKTTPPRGTRRSRFRKGSFFNESSRPPRGSMAGPLIFSKNGYVNTPKKLWYDQKY
jgi:hypothetical protein